MNKDANNKTTKNTFALTRKQNETKQQQQQQQQQQRHKHTEKPTDISRCAYLINILYNIRA